MADEEIREPEDTEGQGRRVGESEEDAEGRVARRGLGEIAEDDTEGGRLKSRHLGETEEDVEGQRGRKLRESGNDPDSKGRTDPGTD